MNKVLAFLTCLAAVGVVSATPFYNLSGSNSSSDEGHVAAGSPIYLDEILNTYCGGYSNYTAVDVGTWLANNATAVIVEEIAGYEYFNTFGWYDVDDNTILHQVFPGPATNGASATFSLVSGEANNTVGFYLTSPAGNKFYTEKDLNAYSEEHVVVFQSNTNVNEYILAFEDLPFATSDRDYNDFVTKVTFQVPEPSIISLLGLTLLSLSGISFLRKKKNV